MRRFLGFLAAAACAGCSHVDLGEIDYRRAEPAGNVAEKIGQNACDVQQGDVITTPRVGPSGSQSRVFDPTKEEQCKPLLPARLFRKNAGIGTAIAKNDVYSIRLEHGLISFMTEPGFDPSRLLYGRKTRAQLGEIVILANVFEFGDTQGQRNFTDVTDLNGVKVVYYSPDVEAGQDLNFSNIPLKAPSRYSGNPIGIQIIVLELDRMSSQMKSLLDTLAGLGQQSNFVTGSPAAGLLLKLGTSMVTRDNDDTIFEHRFVLDPSTGLISADSAPFEAGRYVLKRTHDRTSDQIWRNLVLDHNTGRLMRVGMDKGNNEQSPILPQPFTDDTYFTINVIKHPTGTEPSDYGFRTFAELGKSIEEASSRRDAAFEDLRGALDEKLVQMRASAWAAKLVPSWRDVSVKYQRYGRSHFPGNTCTLVADYDRQKALLLDDARHAALAFRDLYAAAKSEKTAPGATEHVFGRPERLQILSMMSPFFVPPVTGSLAVDHLTDPTKFETDFIDAAPSALFEALRLSAEANWASRSCPELIAMNLATK